MLNIYGGRFDDKPEIHTITINFIRSSADPLIIPKVYIAYVAEDIYYFEDVDGIRYTFPRENILSVVAS